MDITAIQPGSEDWSHLLLPGNITDGGEGGGGLENGNGNGEVEPEKKRRRVTKACDQCSKRRRKCEGGLPGDLFLLNPAIAELAEYSLGRRVDATLLVPEGPSLQDRSESDKHASWQGSTAFQYLQEMGGCEDEEGEGDGGVVGPSGGLVATSVSRPSTSASTSPQPAPLSEHYASGGTGNVSVGSTSTSAGLSDLVSAASQIFTPLIPTSSADVTSETIATAEAGTPGARLIKKGDARHDLESISRGGQTFVDFNDIVDSTKWN